MTTAGNPENPDLEDDPVKVELQTPARPEPGVAKRVARVVFRRPVNPEFENFVQGHLAQFLVVVAAVQERLPEKLPGAPVHEQLARVRRQVQATWDRVRGYFDSLKFYTETTEAQMKELEHALRALLANATDLRAVYEASSPEDLSAPLQLVTAWGAFHAHVQTIAWKVERPPFPYLIYAVFGLALVFIPFLNLFSLLTGVYLVGRKDWRAIAVGLVTLVLFFVQWINVVILWL